MPKIIKVLKSLVLRLNWNSKQIASTLVIDEKDENVNDNGSVDGESSTMTTTTITNKNIASDFNINDNDEGVFSNN